MSERPRPELAEFLRARREALRPADVGLPDSGRRRTPGLRREEVATLAGVSIDYLVRLEQGRDLHPSSSVLGALAKALRLTDAEKRHLVFLAADRHPDLCPSSKPSVRGEVSPGIRQLLESLSATPAFVVGPASDVLGWNAAWKRIVAPFGLLDDAAPNMARYVFTDERARTEFLDWSEVADEQVSWLRAAEPRWGWDDAFAGLLAELRPLTEFGSRWSAHEVAVTNRGVTRLQHPDVGELTLRYEALGLPDEGHRLITWLPADETASAPFQLVVAGASPTSPARLRIVSNE